MCEFISSCNTRFFGVMRARGARSMRLWLVATEPCRELGAQLNVVDWKGCEERRCDRRRAASRILSRGNLLNLLVLERVHALIQCALACARGRRVSRSRKVWRPQASPVGTNCARSGADAESAGSGLLGRVAPAPQAYPPRPYAFELRANAVWPVRTPVFPLPNVLPAIVFRQASWDCNSTTRASAPKAKASAHCVLTWTHAGALTRRRGSSVWTSSAWIPSAASTVTKRISYVL